MTDLKKLRDIKDYEKRYPKSKAIFLDAQNYIPGGANSTARTLFSGWDPFPLAVEYGEGSKIKDVDGNTYIDYLLGLGPCLLGHRHPEVTEAVTKHINEVGTCFALTSELDSTVAKKLTKAVKSFDKVRLSNSGTEAVEYCLRLARAYTGKKKIIRFEGMYHGFSDAIYWSKHPSDKAIDENGHCIPEPQGPGLPEGIKDSLIILQWNDLDSLKETIEKYHDDIAAVITEPIMCNTGCILPKEGYLQGMRQLTEEYGIVLIFDEVITGFRTALGGAQEYYNIKPDLSVFAKGVGGGYPVACLGGKKEIMKLVDDGIVSVAGTYAGNGIALSAVDKTLDILQRPGTYEELYRKSLKLMNGLQDLFKASKLKAYVVGIGPLFQVWFSEHEINNYRDAVKYADGDMFTLWWEEMLKRGILFHPHYFENLFVSMVHTDEDIDKTLLAAKESIKALEERLGL